MLILPSETKLPESETAFQMHKTIIPFPAVHQLAKTDVAYATLDPALKSFYRYAPALENFHKAIADRKGINTPTATLLTQVLGMLSIKTCRYAAPVIDQIEALRHEDTFTVTTAHQPRACYSGRFILFTKPSRPSIWRKPSKKKPANELYPCSYWAVKTTIWTS
jgi:hypothetical protein